MENNDVEWMEKCTFSTQQSSVKNPKTLHCSNTKLYSIKKDGNIFLWLNKTILYDADPFSLVWMSLPKLTAIFPSSFFIPILLNHKVSILWPR